MAFAAREYLAAHFATHEDLHSLQTGHSPGAPKREIPLLSWAGIIWFVQRSPDAAIEPYQAAIRLNPFDARTWFDLAAVYQYQGRTGLQENALQHAIDEDPTTPDVAWEAANLYAVQGETDKALKEFRIVLENDPYRPPEALPCAGGLILTLTRCSAMSCRLCRRFIRGFWGFWYRKNRLAAAAKVWSAMAQLGQPIERGYVLGISAISSPAREVDHAQLGWQQVSGLCQLSAYQPTSANLVVNGDFSLDMLNGGFDWTLS